MLLDRHVRHIMMQTILSQRGSLGTSAPTQEWRGRGMASLELAWECEAVLACIYLLQNTGPLIQAVARDMAKREKQKKYCLLGTARQVLKKRKLEHVLPLYQQDKPRLPPKAMARLVEEDGSTKQSKPIHAEFARRVEANRQGNSVPVVDSGEAVGRNGRLRGHGYKRWSNRN